MYENAKTVKVARPHPPLTNQPGAVGVEAPATELVTVARGFATRLDTLADTLSQLEGAVVRLGGTFPVDPPSVPVEVDRTCAVGELRAQMLRLGDHIDALICLTRRLGDIA
jgi:hypothetical protein